MDVLKEKEGAIEKFFLADLYHPELYYKDGLFNVMFIVSFKYKSANRAILRLFSDPICYL